MNVIGRYKSHDGQKQKPENGCFTGFLASPARFERAAPRLGEAPIRHQEMLCSAKKSRNFKAFSLFHIS